MNAPPNGPNVEEGEDGKWYPTKEDGSRWRRGFNTREAAMNAAGALTSAVDAADGAGVSAAVELRPHAQGRESSEQRAWQKAARALRALGKLRRL